MEKMKKKLLVAFILGTIQLGAQETPVAQVPDKTDIRYNISADGKRYIKFTFTNQVWMRYNQSNPGTTVMGKPEDHTFDIGLRRTRVQLFGQVTDRVFFYTQFGQNNFNFLSANSGNRKLQAFFHDALGEYIVFKDKNWLKFGAGLTITNGLSRFSQPSIGTIMTLDVPVFAQVTVDQTDQFSRKLSFYARGQVKHFDYRVAITDPFPVTTNGAPPPALGADASFTPYGHTKQYQGFFAVNFFDSEQHVTPYMQGTYLGKKKVLNVEFGGMYQPEAMWRRGAYDSLAGGYDTLLEDMVHVSAALYLDMPLNKDKGTAISAYLGYFNLNYGKNYVRHNGQMNPANGVKVSQATFSGAGNAYPMFGTGNYVYGQFGYLMKKDLLGDRGTFMPYVSGQYAQLQKIKDPVFVFNVGINWLISGHTGKISLDYQNRPTFKADVNGDLKEFSRLGCVLLQYQVSF